MLHTNYMMHVGTKNINDDDGDDDDGVKYRWSFVKPILWVKWNSSIVFFVIDVLVRNNTFSLQWLLYYVRYERMNGIGYFNVR